MAKFSQIVKGKLARKAVEFTTLDGQRAEAALVPIIGEMDTDILASACAFARKHGVENPKPGDPLYERGLTLHTVYFSTVDIDVTDKNERYFASVEEIGKHLDPDRIALLFNMQRAWQAEVAPPIGKMSEMDFLKHMIELADAAIAQERGEGFRGVPFDYSPLATQLSFVRILAARHVTLVYAKSRSGSESPDTGQSSSASSSVETTPPPPEKSTPPKSSQTPPGEAPSPPPTSTRSVETPVDATAESSGGDP